MIERFSKVLSVGVGEESAFLESLARLAASQRGLKLDIVEVRPALFGGWEEFMVVRGPPPLGVFLEASTRVESDDSVLSEYGIRRRTSFWRVDAAWSSDLGAGDLVEGVSS